MAEKANLGRQYINIIIEFTGLFDIEKFNKTL
jgi:hypothetical protein